MRYSRPPGPALGTILIISAIDVLLCSFTAGLTLFIFTPSQSAQATARSSSVSSFGGGAADSVRVIISNDEGSDLHFTGGDGSSNQSTSDSGGMSILRLKGLPSLDKP